jgi:hypothetical protein
MHFGRAALLAAGVVMMMGMEPVVPRAAAQSEPAAAVPAVDEDDDPLGGNRLGNHPLMVDRIDYFHSERLADGLMDRVAVQVGADGISRAVLVDKRNTYPRRGSWSTPEVATAMPFTELLPSWSADTPAETGLLVAVRTRDAAAGEWSPWLHIGSWGRVVFRPDRAIEFDGGRVICDYLKLDAPADAYQVRVSLNTFDLDEASTPALRLLAVSYSGIVRDPELRARVKPPVIVDGNWARNLPVPFTAQRSNGPAIGGSTCSPTSVQMVMSYHGIDLPARQVAVEIYDPEYGIFGNWNRATAFAGAHGLNAWLVRVRTWEEVRGYIARGLPLIASIRFEAGTFPSNPMRRTSGHLIVIRGLTPDGNGVIVNDPAHAKVGESIIYDAGELARAWFDRGGVAYVFDKDLPH